MEKVRRGRKAPLSPSAEPLRRWKDQSHAEGPEPQAGLSVQGEEGGAPAFACLKPQVRRMLL